MALRAVVVALVLSAVWVATALGEGTATYEASIGSYGSGNGQFSHPAGVALDAESNLWVTDQGNDRVQKFNEAGEYVSQFGSPGSENGQFAAPKAIAIDAEGNIWIADSGNGRLQQFDDEGEFIKAVGTSGSGNGQFSGPEDIAIDAEGNIWVADTYNYRVQELDDEGEFIKVVSPEGLGAIEPTGIDVGSGGRVWVTDWAHNRVVVLSEAGAFVNQYGSGGSGDGEFSRPDGIDVDSKGSVWVGDEGNSRVQRFNEKGEYLDQFGSGGSGEGEFSFSYPFGIVADSGASIWIADSSNNRVQRWSTTPVPHCHAGSASTEADEPLVLEAGALECEGEAPLAYEIVSGPEHGEISGFDAETGALTYTPDSEFTGLDSFTFKATNGVGSSAAKTFTVAVGEIAACHDGEDTTVMDEPLVLGAGALECEGEAPLEYEIFSGPEHGEISGFDAETGALTYTPDSEYFGPDSFTFRAVNPLGPSAIQSFAVTVLEVPLCHNGWANTEEEQPLVLEAGALECEGEAPLSYEIVSGPEHGEISGFDSETGALTYTPDSEFTGLDSFTFKATNGLGSSAVKTFTVAVGEVAVCHDGEGTTAMDDPLLLEAGALECEGEAPLSYEIVSGPEHGEISGFDPETGALTYTPQSEYVGPDSFTFRAVNALGPSPTQSFAVTVLAVPLCHNGWATTEEEQPLVLEAGALECEGEAPLSYEIVSGPEHGEISGFDPETGALTYTPESEFTGLDSFTFRAANGVGSSAVKSFEVAVGDFPSCKDGEASTAANQPLVLEAGALECEGEAPLSYEIVSGPEHGEISGFDPETGALTYTPESEFTGLDSFTFRTTNGLGSSPTQSLAVTVLAVPLCHNGEAATPAGEPLVLEAGALECEGEAPLSYEIVSGPEHGEISEFDPETGVLTYTPEAEFNGYDLFRFRAVNGVGPSPTKTFEIEVGEISAGTPVFQFSFGGNGFGEGRFQHPTDVAVDEDGHVFVLDGTLYTVQKFNERGEFIDEFGDYGSGNGHLNHPSALAVDSDGNIWVADSGNNRIEQFGPEGEYLDKFGSSGGGYAGYSAYWEGHGHFNDPGGIAIDASGNIYVSDSGNHRIQKFDDEGNFLAVHQLVGEVGPGEFVYPNPPRVAEDVPAGIAVGPNGDVWFAERANVLGSVTRLSSELKYLGEGEFPPESELLHPQALDVDSRGNVWVGDGGHDRVVEFNKKGKFLNAFGKWSGFEGGNFDFGSSFGHFGLDVDAHNRIWIADENNDRVQRWVEHKGQAAVCEERDATTAVDHPLHLTAADLGCEGEAPLSFEIASGPEHGEISEFDAETGALTYTPDSEYKGPDSFSFQVTNGLGSSGVTSLSIEVGQSPSCSDLKVSTEVEEPLAVQLDCTGDHAGDAYEILKEPGHGEISEFDAEDGSLTYAPDPGFQGIDKFAYQRSSWVHDGRATVTIAVCAPPTVEAWGDAVDPETSGLTLRVYATPDGGLCAGVSSMQVWIDEELVYSESRDCGKAEQGCRGMDLIRDVQLPREKAIGTHDLLVKAEDEVGRKVQEALPEVELKEEGTILDLAKEAEAEPEEGKCRQPRLIGEVVVGSYCSETIHRYRGATVYRGAHGADTIYGSGKGEFLAGDEGADTIVAGRGSDKIKALGGNDRVLAGSGDDVIWGGDGGDILNGGPGADIIKGEDGDDLVRGGATVDRLFGGSGENTLSYADGVTPGFFLEVGLPPLVKGFPAKHGERGVYVNLAEAPRFADNGESARYGGGADKIRDNTFQDVIGTPFADLIVGSDADNVIDAGAGTDIVRGGDGADAINGGPNQDYLDGGVESKGKDDEIEGGEEDTCLDGNAPPACSTSPEVEIAPLNEDHVLVGALNAHSPHGESSVYVRGSVGNDQIIARLNSEEEVILELDGSEAPMESDSCAIESGGTKAKCTGTEIASFSAYGGAGNDQIEANGFPSTVTVTLLGGDGEDHLIGGKKSEDVLVGGADASGDHLRGRSGDDTLFSSLGKDTLMGGAGDDLFVSSSLCDGDQIRGGGGDDNANWAQLAGEEIKKEGYPAKPTDPPFGDLANGVQVRMSKEAVISREGVGCNEPGEVTGTIAGVENLEGSSAPDVLIGNGENNVLLGRGGSDVLSGRGGNDSILANNRNPHKKLKSVTNAEKRDLDTRLECGPGKDTLKLDKADALHFSRKQLKGCDIPPNKTPKSRIEAPANYRVPPDYEGEDPPGESLDERVIGGSDAGSTSNPVAFFRFDEATGASTANWALAVEPEEEEEVEEEGEPREESEEELKDLEEEELEEEEEFEEEGTEEADDEVEFGTLEGGVTLDQEGAMEGSRAIGLDGVDDYVDLSDGVDPGAFVFEDCGQNVSGYSVEMWVKFDGEASGTEELFSRSEGGEGLFLYRSADGRLNFSVREGIESPTVSSDQPIEDGEWHQVVAVMAQRAEGCITVSRAAVSAKELESLQSPEMILYVDGFPYTLGVGFEHESIIPQRLSDAHNIVGASVLGGGGLSNWLAGSVDDVAIYGHPLGFGEVEEHLGVSNAIQPSAYLEPFPDSDDTDEDGTADSLDNCAEVANPEQGDEDLNGIGDVCEPEEDSDEDGIVDEADNCPEDPNPLQEDLDENEVGDVCEAVE